MNQTANPQQKQKNPAPYLSKLHTNKNKNTQPPKNNTTSMLKFTATKTKQTETFF
jgi:hypothetical protein